MRRVHQYTLHKRDHWIYNAFIDLYMESYLEITLSTGLNITYVQFYFSKLLDCI